MAVAPIYFYIFFYHFGEILKSHFSESNSKGLMETSGYFHTHQSIKKTKAFQRDSVTYRAFDCVCVLDQDEFFALLMLKAEKRVLFHQPLEALLSFLFVFCVSLEEFAGGAVSGSEKGICCNVFFLREQSKKKSSSSTNVYKRASERRALLT